MNNNLNFESNKIIQPKQIKLELMEHQRTSIYSMLLLEKNGYVDTTKNEP